MSSYEVPRPILNSPFGEPAMHWQTVEGEAPERRPGRWAAVHYYRDPKAKAASAETGTGRTLVELEQVNLIREANLKGYAHLLRHRLRRPAECAPADRAIRGDG